MWGAEERSSVLDMLKLSFLGYRLVEMSHKPLELHKDREWTEISNEDKKVDEIAQKTDQAEKRPDAKLYRRNV